MSRRKISLWAGLAGIGIMVIISLSVVSLVVANTKRYQQASAVAEILLNSIEQGNYVRVQSLLTSDQKRQQSVADVAQLAQAIRSRYGVPLGHQGPVNWKIVLISGHTHVLMEYNQKFRGSISSIPVIINLQEDSGQWLVGGFRYKP